LLSLFSASGAQLVRILVLALIAAKGFPIFTFYADGISGFLVNPLPRQKFRGGIRKYDIVIVRSFPNTYGFSDGPMKGAERLVN
jgi:hypothetical protein